jgi:hypothetical protein
MNIGKELLKTIMTHAKVSFERNSRPMLLHNFLPIKAIVEQRWRSLLYPSAWDYMLYKEIEHV